MAKSISHDALDAAFEYIASRADTLVLCSGPPLTVSEAMTPVDSGGRMLGASPLVGGLGNGDFTVAPGLISGRRLAVSARDGLAITVSGSVDHLAVVSRIHDEVLMVTALTEALPVEAGSMISLNSFSNEIADPV